MSSRQAIVNTCRVGDWVLASSVLEWSSDRLTHRFTPPNQVSAGLFGLALVPPWDWVFRGCFYIEEPCSAVKIWRREE